MKTLVLVLFALGTLALIIFVIYQAWKNTKNLEMKCPKCGSSDIFPLGESISCSKCLQGFSAKELRRSTQS